MILVALDPSIRSCGVAVFRDEVLVHASAVKRAAGDDCIAGRSLDMARAVVERVLPFVGVNPPAVALEWPQIYRAQRALGDPNDLPPIAAVGTAVAAMLGATVVHSYTPREWAGQVPKATKGDCKASPRALRIRSRLAGPELAVWEALRTSDHDAVDAIGIGCHHLGRRQPATRPCP